MVKDIVHYIASVLFVLIIVFAFQAVQEKAAPVSAVVSERPYFSYEKVAKLPSGTSNVFSISPTQKYVLLENGGKLELYDADLNTSKELTLQANRGNISPGGVVWDDEERFLYVQVADGYTMFSLPGVTRYGEYVASQAFDLSSDTASIYYIDVSGRLVRKNIASDAKTILYTGLPTRNTFYADMEVLGSEYITFTQYNGTFSEYTPYYEDVSNGKDIEKSLWIYSLRDTSLTRLGQVFAMVDQRATQIKVIDERTIVDLTSGKVWDLETKKPLRVLPESLLPLRDVGSYIYEGEKYIYFANATHSYIGAYDTADKDRKILEKDSKRMFIEDVDTPAVFEVQGLQTLTHHGNLFTNITELTVPTQSPIQMTFASNEESAYFVTDAKDLFKVQIAHGATRDTIRNSVGKQFSDIETVDEEQRWAIEYLNERGIVTGDDSGTLAPDRTLNRAELLKILLFSQEGIDVSNYNNCFSDVAREWFAPYVCFAKEKGYIEGYEDGTFKPSQDVNKVEAMKMIVNILGVEQVSTSLPYTDIEDGAWYVPFVEALEYNGVLYDEPDQFTPDKNLLRKEAFTYLFREKIREEYELSKVSKEEIDRITFLEGLTRQ